GLEWSVDPNQDGDLSDQLHVVNLSLGGGFGTPYELYNKAVSHLSQAGTIVVASAGNSSDVPYIVGSPSTSDEALSVAASIDGSDHNWRFKTVGFFSGDKEIGLAEAFEAQTSKPIAEAGDVKGELVFVGLADKDFSEAESALIKGKVALIDRGVVTFQEKMSRAQAAGAIGVVVAQNRPEAPFTMGGDKKLEILAIMIGQDLGKLLKAELENGAVQVVFQNPKLIEKPELINQITDFSSRGPRSTDLLIKPEITGPGQNIISAAMGEGNGGVKLSGTSMSGPHLAGVMALLSQKFPQLSSRELKSVVMSTSFSVKDKEGRKETVAKQGAGHVSVARALKAQFVTEPSSLTLGLQSITQQKRVVRTLKVKSLFDDQIKLKVSLESSSSSVKLTDSEVLLDPKG
ncbi:MAG: S8 family serine peptidase, partial [Bdellovibrionales bacterium]